MDISTKLLSLTINGATILNNVSTNINDKEFVGIIGPNGSGKSSLLKCIYRVMKPSDGCIYLDGKNLMDYTIRDSAKKLAVVAQHNFYNFDFAVKEIVLLGRSPHKKILDQDHAEDFRIAYDALKKVGMLELQSRNFSTLSGGEQQRVILARALAQQTECLILDEPTNHLDIKYQLQMLDIVKQLHVTVFAAIHDLNLAAMYCDKIYALKNGEVVGYGSPDELITEDFIYKLYDVRAKVTTDESTGKLNVIYKPSYLSV